MTTPAETPAPAPQRWVYLGTFKGTKYATVTGWRDPQGADHYWKSSPATRGVVGGVHLVTVGEDGTWFGSPAWTGDYADDGDQLRLDDRARTAERERAAAIRKARTTHPAQSILDDLGRFAHGLTSGARQQLIDDLTRAVWRA